MQNSGSEILRPLPNHALAEAFYAAVTELSRVVEGGNLYLVEAEAFAHGASKVRSELKRLEHGDAAERAEAEARSVALLDRLTTVALETSPRHRDIHRAAFEVAVRSSQLAFVLRELQTPITWH